MVYNTVAQDEADAQSESDTSEILQEYRSIADLVPLSPHTENVPEPRVTRSREGSVPLRHPTPDLQSLQGAYVNNIERLEQSAERISLSSDIGEEIRKIKLEQRRSESRRSSLQSSLIERHPSITSIHRKLSHGQGSRASNSIVETNNIARFGGFSPTAYVPSPKESSRSGSWSHHNSVKGRSASQGVRLSQVAEPALEGTQTDHGPHSPDYEPLKRPLQVMNETPLSLNDIDIPHTGSQDFGQKPMQAEDVADQRGSIDTFRQSEALFSDFDGTHTEAKVDPANGTADSILERRSSQMLQVGQPPPSNMVYYPAPVPMMLNLPKRLSKMPATPLMDKRRSEMMDSLPLQARKSAHWLPGISSTEEDEDEDEDGSQHETSPPEMDVRKSRSMANIPPQLRATMFFDQPSAHHDIAVQGESAVATLDSILDASAFAPVSAFTDHPIVGQIGADVYAREILKARQKNLAPLVQEDNRRKSLAGKLTKRKSSDLLNGRKRRSSSLLSLGNFGLRKSSGQELDEDLRNNASQLGDGLDEDTPLQDHDVDLNGQLLEHEGIGEEDGGFSGEPMQGPEEYEGAPTTLLAELQMRKAQMKKRTRAAATAFPDGMHSTLLQLDAVAQVERQARKQKHTALAWEDPNAGRGGIDEEDDDDVPLGILQAGRHLTALDKSRRFDEDRPLGLIARRELEDSEPLSHRRARLRGEDPLRNQTMGHRDTMQNLEHPGIQPSSPKAESEQDEDHPHETLGERRRRLRATQIRTEPRPVSSDFASEMLSQLGGLRSAGPQPQAEDLKKDDAVRSMSTRTPDNLGGEETLGQRRKRLQAASATTQVPANVNGQAMTQDYHVEPANRPDMPQRRSMADILQAHPAAGASGRKVSNEVTYTPARQTRNTAWAVEVNRQAALNGGRMASYSNGRFAVGTGQIPGAGVDADSRQMDFVDRWRQSVVQ